MSHDVLTALKEVVAFSTHEIESPTKTVLDEVVPPGFIRHLLHSLDINLWQTVIDDVAGEEVDAPS